MRDLHQRPATSSVGDASSIFGSHPSPQSTTLTCPYSVHFTTTALSCAVRAEAHSQRVAVDGRATVCDSALHLAAGGGHAITFRSPNDSLRPLLTHRPSHDGDRVSAQHDHLILRGSGPDACGALIGQRVPRDRARPPRLFRRDGKLPAPSQIYCGRNHTRLRRAGLVSNSKQACSASERRAQWIW